MSEPMRDPRIRRDVAKSILDRHFPHGNKPDGLLIDIFKALGEAEQRGFVDCMQIFEPRRAENDNASKAQPQ